MGPEGLRDRSIGLDFAGQAGQFEDRQGGKSGDVSCSGVPRGT